MKIPDEWKELLTRLQGLHRKCVIAGGALRDLDHGFAPKDLDIFVGCGSGDEAEGLNKLFGGEEVEASDQWYSGSVSEIILVTDGPEVGGLQSQFIFINWDVFRIVDRFDFGLCQIAYDGQTLIRSENYKRDQSQKEFRLVRADSKQALERSVERFARWKPKYPKHTFTIGDVKCLGNSSSLEVSSLP